MTVIDLKHLKSGHEYIPHALYIWRIGSILAVVTVVAFIHGVLPWVCTDIVSRTINKLHETLKENPHKSGG